MLRTYIRLFLALTAVSLVACTTTTPTRSITIASIGQEDVSLKNPINVLVYQKNNASLSTEAQTTQLNNATDKIIENLKSYELNGLVKLNNIGSTLGAWKSTADEIFDENEYNWLFEIKHTAAPKVAFRHFSKDIDSSKGMHFRFYALRSIEFANIDARTIDENYEFWLEKIIVASTDAAYLLLKGNDNMEEVVFTRVDGLQSVGTLLGETHQYKFIFYGEKYLFIAPRNSDKVI